MKIIILTGKFGMGHMMAAQAIKQHIDDSPIDAETQVIDWLDYCSPRLADRYYSFYQFLVKRGSRFYNARYRFLENKKTDQKPELRLLFEKYFLKLMQEKHPDMIISTLPLCSQIISRYKEETKSTIPFITFVTDITGHSEWINKNTNYYFVGSASVAARFRLKGVPPEKIIVSGLPVRLDFLKVSQKEEPIDGNAMRHILIMGGGLGMLPRTFDFYDRLEHLPNTMTTIITGKNTELYQRLSGRYHQINVLGYVKNVCDYMRQSDVILTKPGGVTTFEAICAEVPILALNPSMQQELYNAQFIQETGIGTIIQGNSIHCLEEIQTLLDSSQINHYKLNIHQLKKHIYNHNLITLLEMILSEETFLEHMEYQKNYHPIREDYNRNEKISFNV